ncbi:endonuclease/exonuclease/phosphatase family protein [Dysgonomonas sp. BGC7]|uniref:endonuclease/exonuclease/phosphatase family protein n=1 Tax=Dysgonomonas sp. BGC7 TaxID=1658008 RepID=UPI000680666D|nr:endonuclease/exonuclease/phosphatase family protein [Dysgonomonas sp. BGC7]MBD8389058.1 endonuclease/exonuclease/phosphatase family protein [Dysgonomonas sp. BGC7]
MKKLIYFILISLSLISCSEKKPLEINVMSFNIRLDHAGDSLNNWQYRKDVAAEVIKTNDIDILGTQEVLLNQFNDLKERLPEYTGIGVGREDGKKMGEFCALFYKKTKFTEIKSGNFWLSETPEIAGSKGWDASYIRVATWAILKDNTTGKQVFAINSHLDNDGLTARIEGGNLLLKKAMELGKGLPIILTGDFNDTPESETIKNITDSAKSDYLLNSKAVAESVAGTEWTFHDFGRLPMQERPLIDYIFVSKNIRVLNYNTLSDKLDGIFVSDHKPIMAKIEIK